MFILLGKVLLGVLGILFLVLFLTSLRFASLSNSRFFLIAFLSLVATRVGVFALVFLVLRIAPESDVVGGYYPQAKSVIVGLFPYRDFTSSYAPFFPYICSYAIRLWDSPLAIVLLAIIFECVAFPVWLWVLRHGIGEVQARLATLLYLTSPLPIMNVAIAGQNQIWIAFFLGLSIYLLMRGKDVLSGVGLSLSLILVKFLPLIFAPPLFVAARKRFGWFAGFILLPIAVYAYLIYRLVDVLMPLRNESRDATSGNIPFLLTAFGNPHTSPVSQIVVIVLGAVVLLSVLLFIVLTHKIDTSNVVYTLTLMSLVL